MVEVLICLVCHVSCGSRDALEYSSSHVLIDSNISIAAVPSPQSNGQFLNQANWVFELPAESTAQTQTPRTNKSSSSKDMAFGDVSTSTSSVHGTK